MKRMFVACLLIIGCGVFQVESAVGQTGEMPQTEMQETAEDTAAPDVSNHRDIGALPAESLLDICLVLDNSGSMKTNDPHFLTTEVVRNFVDGLGVKSHLGMVVFDQDAEMLEPLGGVADEANRESFLASLSSVDYQGQFTNSPAAIERAIYELKANGRKDAQKVIIFLTDGIIDTGDRARDVEKEKWLKEDLAQESRKADIRIFGIAFTDNADFLLIQTLAIKTDGEYFRAYQAEDIQGVFEKINALITEPPVMSETPAITTSQPETIVEKQPGPVSTPTPKKEGVPVPLAIAGIIVVIGIAALIFLFKGKGRKVRPVAGDAPAGDREAPAEPPLPRAELIDLKKEVFSEPVGLAKPKTSIGREAHNDIAVTKETVSADHAAIEFEKGYFYLEDLRSANGTHLNNQKIESNRRYRLKAGDLIKFDVYEFRFSIAGQSPVGGTVLAGGGNESRYKGTVLRSPKEPEKSSSHIPESGSNENGKQPEDRKSPALEPSEKSSETRLKSGMCPNHPARRSTELCTVCKNAFCRQCVTEKDGKTMCSDCAPKNQ